MNQTGGIDQQHLPILHTPSDGTIPNHGNSQRLRPVVLGRQRKGWVCPCTLPHHSRPYLYGFSSLLRRSFSLPTTNHGPTNNTNVNHTPERRQATTVVEQDQISCVGGPSTVATFKYFQRRRGTATSLKLPATPVGRST